MQRAPITACLIVKNEAPHIEETLRAIRPHVSEIVVVDTGSTDATPEICQKYADKWERFTECNDSEGRIQNFSMARNRSFELASQPWVLWVDGDDTVEGFEKLSQVVEPYRDHPTPVMFLFPYEYDHDSYGNCTCRFYRERLMLHPSKFQWLGWVHETCVPQDASTLKLRNEDIKWVHRRRRVQKTIEGGRNLRILQAAYADQGESDPRTLYYLALETQWTGNFRESLRLHKRYIEISGWDDERCMSCLEVSRLHEQLGEYDQAIEAALKAITIKENWGEPFFALCRAYYFLAQKGGPSERRYWEKCAAFARKYLESPPADTLLFLNPMDRQVEVHRFLNMALCRLDDVGGAIASCEKALAIVPDDGNFRSNLKLYRDALEKFKFEREIERMHSAGHLDQRAAQLMLAALHGRFQVRQKQVASAPPEVTARVTGGMRAGLDIVIFTGPAVERWNPDTLMNTGMGGSETMAWEMAWRLARMGNRVRVYGDCPDMEGTFRGVEWIDAKKFGNIACDLLITSRRPQAVDPGLNIQARARVCWVHDIHCGRELTNRRSVAIDRFFCLSQWHRETFLNIYPFVHPDQVIQTRNGIDLSLFKQSIERHPHRIIYTSSPDRGLEPALRAMPAIRERVPDAELHIFYGFKTWETCAPPEQQATIAMLRELIKAMEPHGVVFRDRVAPDQLAKEFLASSVWVLPCWFQETSCIGAMQAHAAGCRMVCSPIAALNETVGERGAMIAGDWLSPEYRTAYTDAVVAALTKDGDADREELRRYARENFDLDALADDWHRMLHQIVADVERSVVVPYKAA